MLDSVDTPAVESQQPIEVQKDAERLGWIPPSRFKGDPARFVDADIYIKRGEEVLPIVKEQNKRLHNELDSLKRESQATAQALKAAQDAIAQMEERHTVATQKAVEDARRQVKAQLAAASEAGDHEGVAELTEQLTKMAVTEPAAAKVAAPAPEPQFTPPADLVEWNAENPWFGTNKRKTALALAVAQELREQGETSSGRTFYDKVLAEVDKELGVQHPRGDKVKALGAVMAETPPVDAVRPTQPYPPTPAQPAMPTPSASSERTRNTKQSTTGVPVTPRSTLEHNHGD